MDNKRGVEWHLDKTVNISHLVTTATIVIAMILFVMKMDSRISVIKEAVSNAKSDRTRIEVQVRDSLKDVHDSLIRIESRQIQISQK